MSNIQYKMLINGELVGGDKSFPVVNPATEEVIADVPQVTAEQITQVISSSKAGFATWSKMSLAKRAELIFAYADILEKHKEEIVDILIAETGKPADNAEYDFDMLTTCLRFFVEEAKRLDQPVLGDPDGRFLNYIMRQPLGVAVGYLAWNFPLLNVG